MQAEHKHKALDQSSQPRTDPQASKQCRNSFPLISSKSEQLMGPTAASAMLEPEKRTLLQTGKNYTPWACEVDCSRKVLESSAFDLLLSSMSESTLSRVLTCKYCTCIRKRNSSAAIQGWNFNWNQKWNPDSEHPNIRRALIVEELIIHLKGAGSNIL